MLAKFKRKLHDLYWNSKLYLPSSSARRLAVMAFLVVSLPVGVYLAQQVIRYRSQAQSGAVEIYFEPSSLEMPPNGGFKVMMDASANEIGFARVVINFDNTKVNLTNDVQTTSLLGTVIEKTSMANANSSGTIVIALGLATEDADNPPSDVFELATINLSPIVSDPNVSTNISYNDSEVQIVDTNTEVLTFTSNPSVITLNKSATSSIARLYFSSPRPQNPQTINSPFDIDILLDTGGSDVDGVDVKINFDNSMLSVNSIQKPENPDFTSYPAENFNNANGSVIVSANIGSSDSVEPVNGSDIVIATLNIEPTAVTDGTQLNYDFVSGSRNDSNVVLSGTISDPVDILGSVTNAQIVTESVQISPTPTPIPPTPSPIPTTAPSSQPTIGPTTAFPSPTLTSVPTATPIPSDLSILLKIVPQGKIRSNVNKSENLTIWHRSFDSSITKGPISLTTNSNGEGQLTIPEGKYIFLVKAPGYLATRFGNAITPILISKNQLNLDLTGVPLKGGDFNGDGVVNEIDYAAYFLPNFLSTTKLVDLDGSGEVNNLDFGIMRTNWDFVDDTF